MFWTLSARAEETKFERGVGKLKVENRSIKVLIKLIREPQNFSLAATVV